MELVPLQTHQPAQSPIVIIRFIIEMAAATQQQTVWHAQVMLTRTSKDN
jgi:hypothetical protein